MTLVQLIRPDAGKLEFYIAVFANRKSSAFLRVHKTVEPRSSIRGLWLVLISKLIRRLPSLFCLLVIRTGFERMKTGKVK